MKEECLICKAPLVYLETDEAMECVICHKKENSKTRCVKGHYVCNECHTAGMDAIIGLCLEESSNDPIEIIEKLMGQPFCHMHGPEHHVMVGSALLTAYRNGGGEIELEKALAEMMGRGKKVPGGTCGFWGACGAGISAGMFVSIISKSTPLTEEPFGLSNLMTSKALEQIGTVGGPRCIFGVLPAVRACVQGGKNGETESRVRYGVAVRVGLFVRPRCAVRAFAPCGARSGVQLSG